MQFWFVKMENEKNSGVAATKQTTVVLDDVVNICTG